MKRRIIPHKTTNKVLMLIDDLIEAYELLDAQAEEYNLQTRRKEP
jgi:hypothetical protein